MKALINKEHSAPRHDIKCLVCDRMTSCPVYSYQHECPNVFKLVFVSG